MGGSDILEASLCLNEASKVGAWRSLSVNQQGLWLQYQLHPASQAGYNIGFCVRAQGDLPAGRLRQSLQTLLERHPMLCAVFAVIDGQPHQRIQAPSAIEVREINASGWTAAHLEAQVRTDFARPFDLSTGPLLRASLFNTGPAENILLLVFEHLVCDGGSYWLLLEELGQIFSGFNASSTPTQDSSTGNRVAYFDYIDWQNQWLSGPQADQQRHYWREQLKGLAPLQLPYDHSDSAHGNQDESKQNLGRVTFALEPQLWADLQAFGRNHAASRYATLVAACQILLHRLSGQDDIALGSVLPGHGRNQWEQTVGLFINPVVLRTDVSNQPTVREFLRHVSDSVAQAQENQGLPFLEVVQGLRSEGSASAHPFNVSLVLQRACHGVDLQALWADKSVVNWGGLTLMPYLPLQIQDLLGDLSLTFVDAGHQLQGEFKFNKSLFDTETIERWAGHFKQLLQAMVDKPDARINELALLSPQEQEHILRGFNDTKADYPAHLCVHELFEQQVKRNPEATALVFEDQSLSYGELNARANQLAHHLRSLGVKPDSLVAICVERSLEMVIGLLGIIKAGGAYVPIDPEYPQERITYMLEDAQPLVVLTQEKLRSRLALDASTTNTRAPKLLCLDNKQTLNLARWRTDGNIEYLGRNDFQVKIRGFRIELGEIESELLKQEGIREACVMAREDTPGDKRLVAYVVAKDQIEDQDQTQAPEAQTLRDHLQAALPTYMVPAAFVFLPSLPLTPNGKLDRKALPAPEMGDLIQAQYEAPVGQIELALAQIWQDVLKVEQVGRHDDFFALGGHSLLAVSVVSQMRRVFEAEIPVRILFENPRLGALASKINMTNL